MPKLQESPKEKPPVPPPLKDEVKDRILRGDIGTEQHIILTWFRFLTVNCKNKFDKSMRFAGEQ